jgi:hypothetical protein
VTLSCSQLCLSRRDVNRVAAIRGRECCGVSVGILLVVEEASVVPIKVDAVLFYLLWLPRH